jgi:hypothetical protein
LSTFAHLNPLFSLTTRLLLPLGELIIGILVGTTVLALGIFMIVSAACIEIM